MEPDRVSKQIGSREYWLHMDSQGAIQYLADIHNRWSLWNTSPVRQAWVRNFIAYYSALINPASWDSSLVFMGNQGEMIKLFSPKARSLIRQFIMFSTKQRLSFQANAQSSGMDILNDVKLANAIMEQVSQEECIDRKGEDLLEWALTLGMSFTRTAWRTDMGEPALAGENGEIIRTGQPCIDIFGPLDVFFDIDIASWDRMKWVEVRSIKNRWDLIAEHPEKRDDLLALPSWYDERGPNYWFDQQNVNNPDLVAIYELYADESPALPPGPGGQAGGRMIIYGSHQCVLYDGPNIYGCIPVEQFIPERIQGTSIGYPKLTDLMGLQEVFDNTISAIATNQSAFAVQSVTIPRGSDINVTQLSGMNLMSFTPMEGVSGGGRPEALQLTSSPAEAFKMIDFAKQEMSDYSMLHPIMQGDATNVTSGSMVASLTANSMEMMNSFNKGYYETWEKTMMHVVNAVKKFGKLPRKVSMKGKSNQVYEKEFVGQDVEKVSAIKILVSNPMLSSTAGRLEIAQQILQVPPDILPEWVGIMDGKPLESLTKGALNQSDLVYMENEKLLAGLPTPVLITDDHAYHIKKHIEPLNDPDIRTESDKIQGIMDHILEHQRLMGMVDPQLMSIIKTGQLPPQEMAAAGPAIQEEIPEGMSNQIPQMSQPAKDPLGRPTNGG